MSNNIVELGQQINAEGANGESGDQPFLKQRTLINEIMDQKSSQDTEESFAKKFFYISGFLSYLKNDEKTYYLACPDETCKKKVMEESVGWRCESCNKTYPNCVPTYVLTAKFADVSDQVYISFYRNEGTSIMGISAEKLKEIKDQGDIQVINDTYNDRVYKHFSMLVRVRPKPQYQKNLDEQKGNMNEPNH